MDHDTDDYSGDDSQHDQGSRPSGKKSKVDGDGKDKKGTINRVNRACNHCRRMKMRCVGAENPPCKRCRNGGLECVMEKPGKSGSDIAPGDDRIRSLESQVSAIQNTLTDLVTTLRAGMPSSSVSNGSDHTPMVTQTTPEYAPSITIAGPAMANLGHAVMGPPLHTGYPHPASYTALHQRNTNDTLRPLSTPLPHIAQVGTSSDRSFPPQQSTGRNMHMSLPPSRAGSVGPEDILSPAAITNPLGGMANMAGLVEAAVERAREEQAKITLPLKRSASEMESGEEMARRPSKRSQYAPLRPAGPVIVESQNLPPRAITPSYKPNPPRTHQHFFADAIAEGYVSEEEGREMMRIFYAGSSNFIPVFDPSVDTWESLRHRSPFAITVLLYIGARVRDGGDTSDLQNICKAHSERIAVHSLFHPVHRIEAVQSMVLLSAFQDAGWLPGGHAVRMALDLGINRSFVLLLRTGMGQGKSMEELEEERQLVVHSRVWFCLYLMEHQMAYGMGRPAIIREDETIHKCRRLLEHPLSITSDARLVSTVELIALRSPLHIELTAAPDLPIAESTMMRLKQANADFDAWERYWDRVLSDRFAKGRGDFYRESVIIQRQYAELFVNSQLLRGIREPTDVINMPEDKKALAIRAMRNAQRCLDICLRGQNYRNGLRYAVHYTHVCAAFAASFLIRIARLFPHELNVKQTAKDVEALASVLSEIPAGRYARSLRLILRKARKEKIIPAQSAIQSPTKLNTALPNTTSTSHVGTVPFSPSQLINSNYYPSTTTNTPAQGGGVGTPPSSALASILSPGTMATGGAGVSGGVMDVGQRMLFNLPPPRPASNSGTPAGAGVGIGGLINDSPSSNDLFEFDSLFAHETLERAGIQLEDNHLPLFLDGTSLAASTSELAPYIGLEQFFIPHDVDSRLVNPDSYSNNNITNNNGNGNGNGNGDALPEGIWW